MAAGDGDKKSSRRPAGAGLRTILLPCFVYIVRCRDGSLYTGWTTDLEGRVRSHNTGTGARYTCSRRPVVLVYSEECSSREEAMSREWRLKRLRRAEKLRLIESLEKPLQ